MATIVLSLYKVLHVFIILQTVIRKKLQKYYIILNMKSVQSLWYKCVKIFCCILDCLSILYTILMYIIIYTPIYRAIECCVKYKIVARTLKNMNCTLSYYGFSRSFNLNLRLLSLEAVFLFCTYHKYICNVLIISFIN